MDKAFKISGIAFTLYGGFTVLIFLAVYMLGVAQLSNIESIPAYLLIVISLLFVIHCLALLCGVYLLKKSAAVHKIALPVSLVILFSVPFGTMTGVIYLIERFKSS